MSIRKVMPAVGLVALGISLALVAPHLRVGWQRSEAAPGAAVAAAEVKPALPPPSSAQLHDARSLGRTFSQVAAQLSPSVVRISVSKTVRAPAGMMMGNPFQRFFGGPQGGPHEEEDEGGAPGMKQRGMGSGVVFDARGYILTNNHVVAGADEVKVTFADGKTVSAKVVGTDPKTDLAVVKVEGQRLMAARFGDSDQMQVGEWTIAIGNPLGLDHSVTVGVLSAKGRHGFGMTQYEDFLQTDASINPGNSGGPLVNLDGEIIGINTMIAGNSGIGFAVPSSMARPIVEQLVKGGKVRRPYLGILMQDLTPELGKSLGASAPDKGALVGQVQSGSPADKAGVRPGDVILKVDGVAVDGSKSVQKTILTKQIGQRVQLGLWRDGKEQQIATTTGELPSDATELASGAGGAASERGRLGLGLQSLTPQIAEQLGMPKGMRGAIVAEVRPGSPAAEAGLRQRDVIVEVDHRQVATADEATRLLAQNRQGGHLLRVQHPDGSAGYVALAPAP